MNLKDLVDGYQWHGSRFPSEDCFVKLKGSVPAHLHGELWLLIEERAAAHNDSLES